MNAADTDNTNRRAIDRLLCAEAGLPCPHCHGIGGVPLHGGVMEICPECLGTGELSQAVAVEVRHPDDEPHHILIEG